MRYGAAAPQLMITMRLNRFAALAAALALVLPVAARAQEALPVGSAAPAHAPLETLDGKPADLGAYVGKGPVLIEFWATWCGNCRALAPTLDSALAATGGRVRRVTVAVSFNETPEVVKKHLATHPMTGDVLYDRTGEASEKFDAPGTSYVVILDKAGRVAYTGMGAKQPKLADAVRKVAK